MIDLQPSTDYTIRFIGVSGNLLYSNENMFIQRGIWSQNFKTGEVIRTKDSFEPNMQNGKLIILKNMQELTKYNTFDELIIEEGNRYTGYEPYISTPSSVIISKKSQGNRYYKANWAKISVCSKNGQCTYYDNLQTAINNGNNKTITLYDNYNISATNLNIPENSNIVIDLNGKSITGNPIVHYGEKLKIMSSGEKGTIYPNISTYNDSILELDNVISKDNGSRVSPYNTATVIIKNSELYCNTGACSSVWLHGGYTTLYVYDSYIEGIFAIGGEGGTININNTTLKATANNAIRVNPGDFPTNITITGKSNLYAKGSAIALSNTLTSTLTIGKNSVDNINIYGNAGCAIYATSLGDKFTVNYNYGTIYSYDGDITTLPGLNARKTVKSSSVVVDGITYNKQYME